MKEAPHGVREYSEQLGGRIVIDPTQVGDEPLDVFIAGDDDEAKAKVTQLVSSGGMRPIDAGHLRRARELEATALLHMEIQGSRHTGFVSAIKVVP
jgi:hypothetical protein